MTIIDPFERKEIIDPFEDKKQTEDTSLSEKNEEETKPVKKEGGLGDITLTAAHMMLPLSGMLPRDVKEKDIGIIKSLGIGAASDVENLYRYGQKKLGITPSEEKTFDISKVPYPKSAEIGAEVAPMAIPVFGEELGAAKVGMLLSKAAPALFAKAVKFAPEIAEITAQGMKYVPNLIAKIGSNVAVRGLYGEAFGHITKAAEDSGATQQDINNAGHIAGIINVVLPGLLKAIPGAYKGIVNRYSKMAESAIGKKEGILSPEEAQKLQQSLGQDVLSFPDLVRSPKLQSFYHGTLRALSFGGIRNKETQAVERIENDAQKLGIKLLGDGNEAGEILARENIAKDIQDYGLKTRKEVSNKFKEFYSKADSENLKLNPKNIMEHVGNALEKEEKSIGKLYPDEIRTEFADIAQRTGLKTKKQLGYIDAAKTFGAKAKEQLSKQMEKEAIRETDYSSFNVLTNKWRDAAYTAEIKGDKNTAMHYSNLLKAAEKDMDASLEKSGKVELKDELQSIKDEWRKRVVPFYDKDNKDILKIMNDGLNYNSDKLEKILTDTRSSEALKLLPEETRGKIISRMISKGLDNPKQYTARNLTNSIDSLPENIKSLIPGDIRKETDLLSQRANQLAPVLDKTKNAIWKWIFRSRHIGYAVGMGALMHGAGFAPMAGAALGAANIAKRFLGSKGLMEAYTSKGTKIPFSYLSKDAPVASRAVISAFNAPKEGEK